MDILFATTNRGKIIEARTYAKNLGIRLHSLEEFADIPAPDENGSSYQENAEIKAKFYSETFNLPCLADDSGLEVFGLEKRPGIDTANYGGNHLSYTERMNLLLSEMKDIKDRAARYVCHLCYFNMEKIKTVEEYFTGSIAEQILGLGGFGYDPIFLPEGFTKSSSQLKEEGVALRTHRIKALERLFTELRDKPGFF